MKKDNLILKVDNLSKIYKKGQIGKGTLTEDFQSWLAKFRKKEDPNSDIVEDVVSSTNSFYAISNLDLKCYEGEKIGIIGHNGAGKSTLLKLLCGITAPTKGSVKYNGKISSMLEVGTGFVPEMSGRENIYLNGTILGMSINEIDQKIEDIIEFSECREFIDTPVKRYSSGMFVKLAFSVASHLNNNIVIMDEVLAVGDAQFQQKCISKMTQIAQEDGKCVIFVSHNMQFIKQFCSRCIVMEKGEKIFDGSVDTAIDIYLDKNNSSKLFYDLGKTPREKEYKSAEIAEFEFINKVDLNYDKVENELLKFRLRYKFKLPIKNSYISLLIKHVDETKVGSIKGDYLSGYNVNEYIDEEFSVNMKMLPIGKYNLLVRIMQDDENGIPIILDEPLQNISIVLYNSKGGNMWPRTLLGYSDLGTFK